MTRTMRQLPALLGIALVVVTPTAAGQASTDPPSTTEPPKKCTTAQKKAAKEQRSLTTATEAIAHDKKARESCSSKSMCARYDAAISAMEKRQGRHETRLARFNEEVEKSCAPP